MEQKDQKEDNKESESVYKNINPMLIQNVAYNRAVDKHIEKKIEKTNVEMVKCPLCDFQSMFVSQFVSHILTAHRDWDKDTFIGATKEMEIYVCSICGKSFYTYADIWNHFANWHPYEFSEALKEEELKVLNELRDTVKQHLMEGRLYCPFEGYKTEDAMEFREHIRHAHYDIEKEMLQFYDDLVNELAKDITLTEEEMKELDERLKLRKRRRAKVIKKEEIEESKEQEEQEQEKQENKQEEKQ